MERTADGARERLRELATRAARERAHAFTKFLDPREQAIALSEAGSAGCRAVFYGADAPLERRVCAFCGGDADPSDWPVTALRATWNAKYAQPAHRDFLGALSALGVGRDALGDIHVSEGQAVFFVLDTLAPFVQANLDKAGSAALRIVPAQDALEQLPEQGARRFRASVASLRLDAVVAAAYDLGREQAAQAVRAGYVKLNYAQETRPDRAVEPGSMLSLRGSGRARLAQADGSTTRSGRLVLWIERFS